MAIVINGSGTLSGLAVGGLPDGTVDAGTLATNSVDSAELIDGAVDDSHIAALASSKLTGALPAISGAALTGITTGKVLQVVNAVQATEVSSNSATYADTGLTLAITPSATSSKILVIASNDCKKAGADTWTNIRCYRDSTEIGGTIIGRKINDTDDSGTSQSVFSFTILDSPSSTSAVTYKTQFNTNSGGGTIRINSGSGSSTICLMEIGA